VAIFFNFNSTYLIHFCKKIGQITTFITVFVICTLHIPQTSNGLQILSKSKNTFVRPHGNRSKSTNKQMTHWRKSVYTDCMGTRPDMQTLSAVFHPSRQKTYFVRVKIICLCTVRSPRTFPDLDTCPRELYVGVDYAVIILAYQTKPNVQFKGNRFTLYFEQLPVNHSHKATDACQY